MKAPDRTSGFSNGRTAQDVLKNRKILFKKLLASDVGGYIDPLKFVKQEVESGQNEFRILKTQSKVKCKHKRCRFAT